MSHLIFLKRAFQKYEMTHLVHQFTVEVRLYYSVP